MKNAKIVANHSMYYPAMFVHVCVQVHRGWNEGKWK